MQALSRAERFSGIRAVPSRPASGTPSSARTVALEEAAEALEVFTGVLERIALYNEWAVGSVWSEERKMVRVTGKALSELVEGGEYEFRGHTTDHPKHGPGFEVLASVPFIQPDRKSIAKFIVRNFKGVTDLKARRFLDNWVDGVADEGAALEQLRQQLLAAPWTVDMTTVSKKAEFKNDDEVSPVLAYVYRDFSTKLAGFQSIKDKVLKALAAHMLQGVKGKAVKATDDAVPELLDPRLIERCWAALIQDPYTPIQHIEGYGFATADAIGKSVNIPREAPVRLKALVVHALDLGCTRGGHTYLTRRQFMRAVTDVEPVIDAEVAIKHGLEGGLIEADDAFGEVRYYTPQLLDAERSLAQRIAQFCDGGKPLVKAERSLVEAKIRAITRRVAPHLKDGLDPSQIAALVGIMTSPKRLHTLTAGPGCGKTALMEILSEVLKSRDFVFCGPTGKSAKVLNNRLMPHGRRAATVHSTLQGGGRKDFQFNDQNPLEGDVLVLDETGMSDNDLADGVLSAATDMHIILLGDQDQLASVGPGAFLKEVLSLDALDHHRLSKTHRNSGGILDVIEQVREGTIDCVDRKAVRFSHHLGEASEEFSTVTAKYIAATAQHGFENVILLIPKREGKPAEPGWNTTYANAVLRDLCNPNAERVPGSGKLHIGDRILIRSNMDVPPGGRGDDVAGQSDGEGDQRGDVVRVVNGDTGVLVAYSQHRAKAGQPRRVGAKYLTLRLDDGRSVDFPGGAAEALEHAYALTVHSAQGSEYAHVIAVVPPASRNFNNRPMLFTGLSRARTMLEIYGEDKDVVQVAAMEAPRRNAALAQRVRRLMGTETSVMSCNEDEPVEDDDDMLMMPAAPSGSNRAMRYRSAGAC